ncbi:MAG: zinc-binding alcohol dehydrogenase [Thermoproteales archaeon]|nr:zinc-binding alcohol dehydrogenase [Thermoproteales archaeon]
MRGKRIVFRDKGIVEIESFDVPKPSKNEVLVETLYSLISPGTELAFLMGLPNTPREYPRYAGYSNIGRIVGVGNNVDDSIIGEIVASGTPHSTHNVVDINKVYPIPESLTLTSATFFHLCAIALQGVRKCDIELGNSVVVLGLGVVGNLALQLAKLSGGYPVIGVDLIDFRNIKAKENGADFVVNPIKGDIKELINSFTDGKGADIVIEATGSPDAIETALDLASNNGRVVLLGSTRGISTVNFYRLVHRKGLTIVGAHNIARPRYESFKNFWTIRDDIMLCIKLLKDRRINVENLISGTYPLDKARDAYRKLLENKDKYMTFIFRYELWKPHHR